MVFILEGIFKGFVQWVYSLCLEMVQYIANSLLEVFQMDLSYFRQVAPVTDDILSIVIAVGWALLLGNLVFQAMKSMVIGLGFEGEDPKLLFTRTFVFAFLLLVSQQICEIGLGISSQVIALLQVPTSVTITIPDENNFTIGASWLLIIIVGIVVMWQFVKLCFEVAERYVVTAILVLMAPLAFGMGGSKNTEDIFKGWCRMFGSMCVMMIMNVIFLKLLISALGYVPSGVAVLPWMLLIVGIARVARKIDGIIARMREARMSGRTVMFYSCIIGSIPGETQTAISLARIFVGDLRKRLDNVLIVNPAEHFVEGMDGDDLMFMWERVQRSGFIDVWGFQTFADIEESFRLMGRKVPPIWSGKDATFSTGCTQEMRIALDVQRQNREMQIIGPDPARFTRRGEYGVGKYFDATISRS